MFNQAIISRLLKRVVITTFVISITSFNFISVSEAASCTEKKYDRISRRTPIRIINHKAPIFTSEKGDDSNGTIEFNLQVRALKTGSQRFHIKHTRDNKVLGWVNREDIFCGTTAAKAENGLPGRLVIRTEEKTFSNEKERKNYKKVIAYSSYNNEMCDSNCRKLSRFVGFFIFDKKQKSDCNNQTSEDKDKGCFKYLISDKQTMESDDGFIGWVNSDDIVLWNTAYALRISESFIDDNVCAYSTLEEAKKGNKDECKIILNGGWSWYDTDKRMLLQKTIKSGTSTFYKLVAPMTGERATGDETFDFSEDAMGGVSNLKKFDVYFLLDGTKSMTNTMKEVKNTMVNIVRHLPDGIQYRFAFQIYRDHYRGKDEFSDFSPFPKGCNANKDTLDDSKNIFTEKLQEAITTTKKDKGDSSHYENLFGGLKIATRALRASDDCPEHQKLLIVIGDTGYQKDEIKFNEVINMLDGGLVENKEESAKNKRPILVFFLQPELSKMANYLRKNKDYLEAYKAYDDQVTEIAKQLATRSNNRFKGEINISPDDYVLSLDKSNSLTERVYEIAKSYGNSRVTSEYQSLVRSGVAPFDAINQLKGGDTIPARFKEQLLIASCGTDREKCGTTRIDKIKEFYVKDSPVVIKDILINNADFLEYQKLIDPIKDRILNNDSADSDDKIAVLLEEVLTKHIESRLRRHYDGDRFLTEDEKNMSIGDIYRNILHIAVPDESPLFNIKISDIKNLPDGIPVRILERLVQYAMLMDIYSTKHKVPLCGISGTDDKEEAAKFLPPMCGRTLAQMAEARKELQSKVNSKNQKYLKNMVNILTPLGAYRFPSASMSIYHKFGDSSDDTMTRNADNMMWVPVGWLP